MMRLRRFPTSDPSVVASAAEVVELVAHGDHLQGGRELVRHVGQVRASALHLLTQPSVTGSLVSSAAGKEPVLMRESIMTWSLQALPNLLYNMLSSIICYTPLYYTILRCTILYTCKMILVYVFC